MRLSLLMIQLLVASQIALAQGVYPLSIGDRWEYWQLPNTYGWSTLVVGDSIMPNGIAYSHLHRDTGQNEFLRQVGPQVFEFSVARQGETLLYDFSKSTGDTVYVDYNQGDTTIVTVLYEGPQNVFGAMRRTWWYYTRVLPTSFYTIRQVTDSIGLVSLEYEGGQTWRCLGAIIDGVQFGTVDVNEDTAPLSREITLFQNFPNPFNPSTRICFSLSQKGNVQLRVYDIVGRLVDIIVNNDLSVGEYSFIWNAVHLPTGTYFYRLEASGKIFTRRMILVR
jgi:hypothetical protein